MKTKDRDEPTEEGFYWATTVARRARRTRPGDYGQRGGLRWIVRVFRFNANERFHVQVFGGECLLDVRDYKDWEGPVGREYWVDKQTTQEAA